MAFPFVPLNLDITGIMNHTQQPEFWHTIKRVLAIVVIIFGFAAALTGLGQSAREFFGVIF
ncbi:hypothetical protein [Corynebacterium yudongzhengii]|uniref:hypothetical protein n=1 Tax=Corynebacterium yudongzhengii TaxID=2080740 RepID=UPI0011B1F5AF|nr:hypothetical protein [Corynebacterium yudongzhengii]